VEDPWPSWEFDSSIILSCDRYRYCVSRIGQSGRTMIYNKRDSVLEAIEKVPFFMNVHERNSIPWKALPACARGRTTDAD